MTRRVRITLARDIEIIPEDYPDMSDEQILEWCKGPEAIEVVLFGFESDQTGKMDSEISAEWIEEEGGHDDSKE